MIRNFLLIISLGFIIFWYSGAYLIKSRVGSLLSHIDSDNIKISYDKVELSGFPSLWNITLIKPKLTFINHISSRQFSIDFININFDFSFKKASLIFSNNIFETQTSSSVEEQNLFSISNDITTIIKFKKPLYSMASIDNFNNIIKSFNIKTSKIDRLINKEITWSLADFFMNYKNSPLKA